MRVPQRDACQACKHMVSLKSIKAQWLQCTQARLEMRGRKAANMRGAAARAAVMKKYKPPPMAVGVHELKPGAQRTLTEMFSRVPQTPAAALVPEVHAGIQDMEM